MFMGVFLVVGVELPPRTRRKAFDKGGWLAVAGTTSAYAEKRVGQKPPN